MSSTYPKSWQLFLTLGIALSALLAIQLFIFPKINKGSDVAVPQTQNFSDEMIVRLNEECVPDYSNFTGELDSSPIWSGCFIRFYSGTISTIDMTRQGLVRTAEPGTQNKAWETHEFQELGPFTGSEIIFLDDPLYEKTYTPAFIKGGKVLQ